MTDLRELYQEVIIDHSRNPRNFGKLDAADRIARGNNPLCGDKLTLYLKLDENDVITDVSFEGAGCAISISSASLMTEMLKGKTLQQAEALFQAFHGLIMGENTPDRDAGLGKLKVLEGVKAFPSRVKCATLAWHMLHAALEKATQPVSTE
ncbi:MAG TPA: SUF system NifU family Fe-S cluster assembly protein [Sedimenticola sp.]|nr:SUF system NifU family Fe-S cluster assembly protein [Sedimenticola sp.]